MALASSRKPPNPRLQRTRFALLRSPLSRKPLGSTKFVIAAVLVVTRARVLAAAETDQALDFRCRGLEAYEIRVLYRVDAGTGSVRSKVDSYSIGLSLGPMAEELVPERRPGGFKWIKFEKVGKATLRYGQNVKSKQLQATIRGSSMNSLINLVAVSDVERFTAVARALAGASCETLNAHHE